MFVRDTESLKFLTSAGQWSAERREAHDFNSFDVASEAGWRSRAAEFDVLLHFPLSDSLLVLDHFINRTN
jgi:hypothetical protein